MPRSALITVSCILALRGVTVMDTIYIHTTVNNNRVDHITTVASVCIDFPSCT